MCVCVCVCVFVRVFVCMCMCVIMPIMTTELQEWGELSPIQNVLISFQIQCFEK